VREEELFGVVAATTSERDRKKWQDNAKLGEGGSAAFPVRKSARLRRKRLSAWERRGVRGPRNGGKGGRESALSFINPQHSFIMALKKEDP